jgi:hypothetical protein
MKLSIGITWSLVVLAAAAGQESSASATSQRLLQDSNDNEMSGKKGDDEIEMSGKKGDDDGMECSEVSDGKKGMVPVEGCSFGLDFDGGKRSGNSDSKSTKGSGIETITVCAKSGCT